MLMFERTVRRLVTILVLAAVSGATIPGREAGATDWPSWRGPEQSGVCRETGLVGEWSPGPEAKNLLWSFPEGGRSTPIVMNGRMFGLTRVGEGVHEQERVLCLNAQTGAKLWEYRFNVYLTDIPSARVGWSSPTGDPETGYVYAHGVQNTFVCLDSNGKVIWERALHEQFGVIMGYGGRTHTPVVDGKLVVLSFLNASWGGPGRHRYVAFDKHTGEVVWWATPGGPPLDTTYSTPVIATVNGVRVLIAGNADGNIYAMQWSTGTTVWKFRLSKRGINSSVVYWNDLVFACHSEENSDNPATMGRLVCIDATGEGDVTSTHEKWRVDEFTAGYSTPAVHDGLLYAIDNSANIICVNINNGQQLWHKNIGRVMKGSPVIADGKIYVGETNGEFLILELAEIEAEVKSRVRFSRDDGTVVEIFGSPAIANGRVYFATADAFYCIGESRWKGAHGEISAPPTVTADKLGPPVHLQIVPADMTLSPGDTVTLTGKLFDKKGRIIGTCQPIWKVAGPGVEVAPNGQLKVLERQTQTDEEAFSHGLVTGTLAKLTGSARVRVVPTPPLEIDFSTGAAGKPPKGWIGAGIKFVHAKLNGEPVLTKVGKNAKFMDAETFFGRSDWKNYTFQADVLGTETRRQMPNAGLVNSRYSFVLMGNAQEFKVVSWVPLPRIAKVVDFSWDPDTWLTIKTRVAIEGGRAIAQGKVWPRGEQEPEEWTVEVEDPTPNSGGSPALHGYSAGITARSPGAKIYYDNIKVSPN